MEFTSLEKVARQQRGSGQHRVKHRRKIPTFRRQIEKKLGVVFAQQNTSVVFATALLVFAIFIALMSLWSSGMGLT